MGAGPLTTAVVQGYRRLGRAIAQRGWLDVPGFGSLVGAAYTASYGLFWVYINVACRRGRQVVFDGTTTFGATIPCRYPDLIPVHIHLYDVWEPTLTRLMQLHLRTGDAFVDVGANIGYFSLLCADAVGDEGAVLSIEASPSIHARLVDNLARNGVSDRVTTKHIAASDREGSLTVYLGPQFNEGFTTTVATRGLAAEVEVPCAPLSDIVPAELVGRVRLMKIDVEGAEPDVVKGLAPLLERLPDDVVVLLEVSPRWWADPNLGLDAMLAPFTEAGFRAHELANSYAPTFYLRSHDDLELVHLTDLGALSRKQRDLVLTKSDPSTWPGFEGHLRVR